MKKQIFALGLMLAATFTLTNCAKEMDSITPENEGVAFEIVASTPQVKTVNQGMKTTWVANDAINLFHAVTDETSYVNDNSFKITADNLAAGKFTGTLTGSLDPQEEYDWYAFYPYSSYIKTPASTSSGYMPVGSKSNEKQKQTGNSNMAHIAGDNYPVAGRATAVPANSTPEIEMSHVSSLLEVKVTNKNEEALTVSSVSFAAPAGVDIVGTYYINFADEVPTFTRSGSNYVSNIAQLEVAGGTALAKEEYATFYLAIKPFTAAANSTLTLSVNGCTKTINVTDPVEFKAGKIKTLNFGYDYVAVTDPDATDYSGEWLITGTELDKLYVATAVDNGNGNNLKSTLQIAINDNTITEVDGLADCKMTITKITDGGAYDGMYTIKDAKGKYLYAAGSDNNYLKGTSTLSVDCYWTIALNPNGTYSIVASKSSNRNVMRFNYNSGTPLVSCYLESSTTGTSITLYPYSMVVPDLTPRIVVAETVKSSVPADGGDVTFKYELRNLDGEDVNVAVSDSDMLAAVAEDGVVTVTVAKNEGEARSATITLSCGAAENVVLTVEQLAAPTTGGDVVAGPTYSYTFTSKQWTANGAKTLNGLSWILAGNGGNYWGYDSTKGQQFGSGSAPYKSMTLSTSAYEGGVSKVVINTSGAKSISGNLVVTVNGVQYGSKVTLTQTATSYTFNAPATGMQKGDIVLTYTQTSSKAIYIKSIAIN